MNNFLTRLEIQGFKSFASKTQLALHARVVGIVGPNGSGKSNIIDAIRWVLGERGAKQLRGDVLSNLMFAGTPTKQAASIARVSLTFNNKERLLPIDSEEVTLTRRIDRSGTTKFLLNDVEVRLKDVVHMLARARMGTRGLTIIGQGQSDVFVRIGPRERREMIEEIIGLKEYRLKKQTAERRLERSKQNMQLVQAQLKELMPHLRLLRSQRRKWEKRDELERQLKELAVRYFATRYHALQGTLRDAEAALRDGEHRKKDMEQQVSDVERQVRAMQQKTGKRDDLQVMHGQLRTLQEEQLNAQQALARAEARLEFRSGERKTSVADAEQLIQLIQSFVHEATQTLESTSDALRNVVVRWLKKFKAAYDQEYKIETTLPRTNEVQTLQKQLERIVQEIAKAQTEEDALLSKREKGNQEFRKFIEALEQEKNNVRTIERDMQTHVLTSERTKFKIQEIDGKWRSLGFSSNELRRAQPDQSAVPEDEAEKTEHTIERLRVDVIAAGEIDAVLIEEAKETEERYTFLEGELQDLEKASQDLHRVIHTLDERIHKDFKKYFDLVNKEFNTYFRLMFRGGKARLRLIQKQQFTKDETVDGEQEEIVGAEPKIEQESIAGIDIQLSLPRKKMTNIDMLSGGEKTLVSLAALFALIAVSPPPFLVLDEIDAALDEVNAQRFAELIKEFSHKTQFIIVTHNRVTMEVIDTLYGIAMGNEGVSRVLSMKLEEAERVAG